MALGAFAVFAINLLVTILITVVFRAKPQQRDQKNDVQRLGVDHDLERAYGINRVHMVVTDHMTSAKQISPASQAGINDVIRSTLTYKGTTSSTSDSKNTSLVVEGPLCVKGRLNAVFQGTTAADVNPQVNEKDYTDASLKTDTDLNYGAGFELHLVGGVRHPLSTYFGLGASTNTFDEAIACTALFPLNIEKNLVYSGIPDLSFDLESNLLFDPNGGSDVWNTSTTWSGRADHAVLQLLDYLLDADFGVGLVLSDINSTQWEFAIDVGNVPTGVTKTTTVSLAYGFNVFGAWNSSTEIKTFTPGYLFESNLLLSTSNKLNDNIGELLAAARGLALFKDRLGTWSVIPDWLHEDDLVQTFTGETGAGPFAMDWPTVECIVKKNTVTLTITTDYTIATTASLTTLSALGVPGTPTGTDPDTVIGISFVVDLIAGDTIEIDYLQSGGNPDGIPGMTTQFHIIDDPATLGLDFDATADANGIDLIQIAGHSDSELALVSLDDRYNQTVVKFRDKETKYKQNQVVWPEDGSATHTAYLAADNGKKLVQEISINSITDKEKALDYAQFMTNSSRVADICTFMLETEAMQMDPNDTVLITDRGLNINGELWRATKLTPQDDTRTLAHFKRYDATVFQYAVEAFSEEDVQLQYNEFGPVLNLDFVPAACDSTISGSGRLEWDKPAGAAGSTYACSISTQTVWDAVTAYASGFVLYYDGDHYTSNASVSAAETVPGVNAKWDTLQNDTIYWEVFAETPTLRAETPQVSTTRSYGLRVAPRSALRNSGIPAYIDEELITNASVYGSLSLTSTPTTVAFSDTVSVAVPMDQINVSPAVGLTYTAGLEMQMQSKGVFKIDAYVTFTADTDASDRVFRLSAYGETSGAFIGPRFIAVAPADATTFSAAFSITTNTYLADEVISLRIGGAGSDTFTTVVLDTAGITLTGITTISNTYDDYITDVVDPNLWIKGYLGVVNSGSGLAIVPDEYAAGFLADNGYQWYIDGDQIDCAAGGYRQYLTSDSSKWTIDAAGSESYGDDGSDIAIALTGLAPPASTVAPQVHLDFGTILSWEVDYSFNGLSATLLPSPPNSPERDTPADLDFDEVVTSGTGEILYVPWGTTTGKTPMPNLQTGTYTQGTASGSGHTGTLRLRLSQLDAYDELSDPSPHDDSGELTTTYEVDVRGIAGYNWIWTQITFVTDSDYTFFFRHTWTDTRAGLTGSRDQILYASIGASSNGFQATFDTGGLLEIGHDAGTYAFTQDFSDPPETGKDHYLITYDKTTETLVLYDQTGVAIETLTSVAKPTGTATGELIGNNGHTATANFFPLANPFSQLWHVDRKLSAAEIAAIFKRLC